MENTQKIIFKFQNFKIFKFTTNFMIMKSNSTFYGSIKQIRLKFFLKFFDLPMSIHWKKEI